MLTIDATPIAGDRMTPRHAAALKFLHGNGPARPEQIGKALDLNSSAVGSMLYELGGSGLKLVTEATRHGFMCLTLSGIREAASLSRGELPRLDGASTSPPVPNRPAASEVAHPVSVPKEVTHAREAAERRTPSGEIDGARRDSKTKASEVPARTGDVGVKSGGPAATPAPAVGRDRAPRAQHEPATSPRPSVTPAAVGAPSNRAREAAPSSPATIDAPPPSVGASSGQTAEGGAGAVPKASVPPKTFPRVTSVADLVVEPIVAPGVDPMIPFGAPSNSVPLPIDTLNDEQRGLLERCRRSVGRFRVYTNGRHEAVYSWACRFGGYEFAQVITTGCGARGDDGVSHVLRGILEEVMRIRTHVPPIVEDLADVPTVAFEHVPDERSGHRPEPISKLVVDALRQIAQRRESRASTLTDEASAIRRVIDILAPDGAAHEGP